MQIAWILTSATLSISALANGPQNQDERRAIEQMRTAYKKQGLELNAEREEQFLLKMRKMRADVIDAQVMAQSTPGLSDKERVQLQLRAMKEAAGIAPANPSLSNYSPAMTAGPAPAGAAQWTSAQLAAEIEKRHAQSAVTVFTPQKDGFLFDGKPFIDTQGKIVEFGGDSTSGDVTYFLEQASMSVLVRYTNVHSQLEPVTVGTISGAPGNIQFQSMDGAQLAGETAIPAGRRVILARSTVVISYALAGATTTQTLPTAYRLAPYQHGDVASTNYVLLRREVSQEESANPFKQFAQIASMAKSIAGKSDDKDYALFSVQSGHTTYLNINEGDEQVGQGTDCHRKNKFLNKCNGWSSHEALYDNLGLPNHSHYFWRVAWMPTADGPTAVLIENGLIDLNVIRLDSDKRAQAFHRPLGIRSFQADATTDGSVNMNGNWMFSDHVIEDVRTLFK